MSFFQNLRRLAGRVERGVHELKEEIDKLCAGSREPEFDESAILILLRLQDELKDMQVFVIFFSLPGCFENLFVFG
jgi:hypothetical protein